MKEWGDPKRENGRYTMNIRNRSLIEIHGAVLLFGLAGLFGKVLTLSPMIIVLGRVFFASIFLGLVMGMLKQDFRLQNRRDYLVLILMGVILAVHWSTFFLSIQMATVAIGLLTFSTFPVFVTFLEPWFFKEKIKRVDVIAALVTFIGVSLVVPSLELDSNLTQGALWGLVSGFTYAVLSMMNRKYVKSYASSVIAFYEQLTATVVLLPVLFIQRPVLGPTDIGLLMLLGIVFTGISHSLFINGLRHVKTQTAGIISTLEPVYGIIFAALLLKEIPTGRELLGGLVILGTVFYSTFQTRNA